MKRFIAIEGLRGWLAWTVVLSHIVRGCGIYAKGIGPVLDRAGSESVMVFVIVSGFVITHLLIEKQERYGIYIFRRYMRIFPLFAVTCVLGYFSSPILVEASSRLQWQVGWYGDLSGAVNSQFDHFWANVFAHLTMMHGAISENILPSSATVYNVPAWSLSLEWQFYLIAPLVLLASNRLSISIAALVVMTVLCTASDFDAFGKFEPPSLLFASAPYFAVGIASRIAYQKLAGSLRAPAIVFALLLALVPLGGSFALEPLAIWGCVYAVLITDRKQLLPPDNAIIKIVSFALENRFVTFMGTRSYSIYLCHMTVLGLALYGITSQFSGLSKTEVFAMLLISVIPLTFALACALYLTVEKPGIALGNKISLRTTTETDALKRAF